MMSAQAIASVFVAVAVVLSGCGGAVEALAPCNVRGSGVACSFGPITPTCCNSVSIYCFPISIDQEQCSVSASRTPTCSEDEQQMIPTSNNQLQNDCTFGADVRSNEANISAMPQSLIVHTAFQEQAVSCFANDQDAIQKMDAQTFGDASNKCGTAALGLTGINHDKFNSCLNAAVGIGAGCAECYAVTADYGFNNCKSACLLGWCKSGCLSCTAPSQASLSACTGIPVQTATPCLESTAVSCSASEQAMIQKMDPNAFGDASNKCGTSALGLTGINHDKFNSCLAAAVGIGAACSECFAETADYGFNNCKSACLLGWCKSGCLSCTAPAQASLPACTGIPTGSAIPCMEVTV